MSEKILFIINPRSGVDRVKAMQDIISKHLDHKKYCYEIAYTQYAKHGTVLAKEAAGNGVAIVVAVGGDGSVNDIICGLRHSDTKLAIIPKGSGNGLARTLNIPLDPAKAIGIINRGRSEKIDLGMANDIIFASNVGVGFDALVARKFSKSSRRGMAVYSWIVTKHLWTYKEWEWELEVDGRQFSKKAFILTIANAQQFGYNFRIAPVADLQDGLFDIVIIKKFPKLIGGLIAMKAFNGTLLKSRFVEHYKGKSISIRHKGLTLMQADGDVHSCKEEIRVRILPQALSVLIS